MVWRAEGPEVRVPYWCGEDNGVVATAPTFEVLREGRWSPLVLTEEEVRGPSSR